MNDVTNISLVPKTSTLNVEDAVRQRYAAASQAVEPALCCPVQYNKKYLEIIPQEVIDRDYGCGDPSQHVAAGETVLDLGSGGGKICFIASQVVGQAGRVLGIDANDEMLDLARRNLPTVAERLGYGNVEFRKGRIQDLALNLDLFAAWLADHPVKSLADWQAAEAQAEHLRQTAPLVASQSVNVVVSNCVLNLVRASDRRQLFAEIFRVLKPGGRAVISDITSNAPVPEPLRNDPQLWSGCISGAFEQHEFLQAFRAAGMVGVEILDRQTAPWTVIDSLEFRSLTVRAYKPLPAATSPAEVIYRGPWQVVTDEQGQSLIRGVPTPVSPAHASLYSLPAFAQKVITVSSDPSCCSPSTKCC